MTATLTTVSAIVPAGGTFTVRPHFLPGAAHGIIKLQNEWRVSVVAGPTGCGLHGNIQSGTFEVAIFNPNGGMIGDPMGYQTTDEVRSIVSEVSGW